nr:PREDICTED: uncharacterized protein LOC108227639 isoform X3 [Daucus carota subsp. sativus]
MNEKPGSSETGHVPRSPGTALYRFLSNKAVMIQRQQTGHQKKDAQSNASISCGASDIGSCNPTNVANAKYSGFLLFCTSHKKVKFLMVMSQEGEVPTGHPNPLVQINYTFPSIQLKFRFPS